MLSGGGVKGLAALGAVRELRDAGRLGRVSLAVGTSVGAVVAATVALGLDPEDVLRHAQRARYRPRLDISELAHGYGLDSGAGLEAWLRAALGPGAGALTLADVRRARGVALVVCVTDLTTREPVYLGPDTHPDLPLVRALRMTCSIPVLFAAVPEGDSLFVDGALCDNFPVAWTLERHRLRPGQVLGVTYAPPADRSIDTLEQFVVALVGCSMTRHPRQLPAGVHTLVLDAGAQSPADFGLPPARMRELYDRGAADARAYLAARAKKLP